MWADSGSKINRVAQARKAVAVAVLLLFAPLIAAQPDIAPLTFEFIPADPARAADSYMDSGGVWNGSAEVSNTTGDRFAFVLRNQAPGDITAPIDETVDAAFDVNATISLPSGFRLSNASALTTAISNPAGFTSCVLPADLQISQTGQTVTIASTGGTAIVLPAQNCQYRFEFGVTTATIAPFVQSGNYNLNYSVTYALAPGGATEPPVTASQSVEVRRGDVIVTKTAIANAPNGGYADGETAQWEVSVFNNGTGGTFAVVVTDDLSVNFNPATLQLLPPASPPGSPFPVPVGVDQYTIAYLDPGETVNITVEAQVAVPAGTGSCPDLRNDVDVIDRLQNTSNNFASVELDLRDPLLDYNPPNFSIEYGTPVTVGFDVTNIGIGGDGGSALDVELDVTGLDGVTINVLSPDWIYDAPNSTFIHIGADTFPASGDEIIVSGGSSFLQFTAEINTCDGPRGNLFVTWEPLYTNICGLEFTPPIRNSTYSVNNFPDLAIIKTVTPTATNFGQPATYTIDLIGANISELGVTTGEDNDWEVTDTLPTGVGTAIEPGIIPTVPAGTRIIAGPFEYTSGPVPVTGGETIIWRGDREDIGSPLPSITVNFTVSGTCPPLLPPVTFGNTANLLYPSCNIDVSDAAPLLVNDSPINIDDQAFGLAGGQAPPFETGRPDTDFIAGNELNEGERITFRANYPFPDSYAGIWSGSAFRAEMGTGVGGLLPGGAPLQLAFTGSNSVPSVGDLSGVTVQVINNNPGGLSFGQTRLPVSAAPVAGAGVVIIDPSGFITIPDLEFIGNAIGNNSMSNMELIIEYSVTAPEGSLDANLQPTDDDNIGIFDERVSLTVEGDPNSCATSNEFTQGIGVALARSNVNIDGSIDADNDAGVCGVTYANINVTAPTTASTLRADNIRILLRSTDYNLPTDANDFQLPLGEITGPLAALNPSISFPTPGEIVEIHVTPNDGDNLADVSTIRFPITVNTGATGRDLRALVLYDSNHTSPDFDGDPLEAYPVNRLYPGDYELITGPTQTAELNIEFFPPNVLLGDPVNFFDVDPGTPGLEGVFNWRVRITNVGTDIVSNYVFSNRVPSGYLPYRAGSNPAADPSPLPDPLNDPLMVWSGLPDLDPGASVEVIVAIGLAQNGGCNIGNPNLSTVYSACTDGSVLWNEDGPDIVFPVIDLELEHRANSFCELCGVGTVDLEVRNEGASNLYDLNITEDLRNSGLRYTGNARVIFEGDTTEYSVAPIITPSPSGEVLTWDVTNLGALVDSLRPGGPDLFSDLNGAPSELIIRFEVEAINPADPEALISASRVITANAEFSLFCGIPDSSQYPDPVSYPVPLRQPQTDVDKQGRNYSARQSPANYSDPVYGGTDDIIIWRIDVANSDNISSANLEDLLINDTIPDTPPLGSTNFTLQYICPTEAAADAQAVSMEGGGTAPIAPCVVYATSYDIDDPFGNPGDDELDSFFVDVQQGSSAFTYYVGTVLTLCTDETNSSSIEWGCEVSTAPGGIDAATPGVVGSDDNDDAFLGTGVDPSGVTIARTFTGTDPTQPVGTKGILTITVSNNSGGTIRDLVLTDTLPEDYQIDTTTLPADPPNTPLASNPALDVNPAFGIYPGMVDRFSVDITNPNEPIFSFISNDQGTANQRNLLRNGDQLILTIGVIRVTPFDPINDPEERTENTADGTDPDYSIANTTNTISLDFDDTCIANPPLAGVPRTDTFANVPINPEDIDINIIDRNDPGSNLIFILSDPDAELDLDVVVSNNGGHDAENYAIYVTVGNGITITTLPGCAVNEPAPAPIGTILLPIINDATSTTYRCESPRDSDPSPLNDILPPGASDTFGFTIQRDTTDTTGDLTFRADVLAASTLSDGSAPPDIGAAGYPYYSKDNILARIIGFNLFKRLSGNCSEDNPPPVGNNQVIIGEECIYQVEANWFGFATPGFGNVEIRDARIYEGSTTNNPPAVPFNPPDALDGQGVVGLPAISLTDADGNPVVGITVTSNPNAPAPLTETGFVWTLSDIDTAAISTPQITFLSDIVYRTLNDQPDGSGPNVHGVVDTDEINAGFVVFFPNGPGAGDDLLITFDESTAGYPNVTDRTANITITEPSVTVTKEICNESVSGTGITCGNFVTNAVGDADDLFIVRLTLTNENDAGGVTRAPAFDVFVTDTTDSIDQMVPVDFSTDGLDNDGDNEFDEADEATTYSTINTALNDGTPAVITIDPALSVNPGGSAPPGDLRRVGPGESRVIYYRARLDTMVTPLQELSNIVTGSYDSLAGDSGSQNPPLGSNGDLGGARVYPIDSDTATIQIANIAANPGVKVLANTSRRNSGLVAGTCAAPCVNESLVVGEEVLVRLTFDLPISELRQFSIEDNLPDGIECVEAFPVTLLPYPANNPGFAPPVPPQTDTVDATTCDADLVRWDFGNRTLQATNTSTLYPFSVEFIGRIQNSLNVNVGDNIVNGGSATLVQAIYTDASGDEQTVEVTDANAATITIQEPQIVLSKFFGFPPGDNAAPPPNLVDPITEADEGDVITVEVYAENTGTSPAYNLVVFDDLFSSGNLTYLGNIITGAGTPLPSVDPDSDGNGNPEFTFAPADPVPVGGSFNFSFQVLVNGPVAPEGLFTNTLSASWTSLPDNTVALNSDGVIDNTDNDPFGDPDGIRNGQRPPDGGFNDYEATAIANASVPNIDIVKTDLNSAAVPTIGERKQFQIQITIPESQASDVVITDDLNTGAVSYVLESDPDPPYGIVYICSDITSITIGAVTTPIDCSTEATATATIGGALGAANQPVDESTGIITWNLGNILTDAEDDSIVNNIDPQITIRYFARINNDLNTDDGDVLQNGSAVTYTGSTGPYTSAVPAITVVEPLLTVIKSLTPPATPPDAGDVLEYTITIQNTGNSTAFDVNIVDTLSTGLAYSSTASALLDGNPIPGFIDIPQGGPTGPLIWGSSRTPADETLDIPAGSIFVLTYEVLVDDAAEPGLPLSNSVLVDWTSLDGVNADERTGAGCPVITAPDDYCSAPAQSTLTNVGDNNQLVKTLSDDSYTGTPDDVRIGDVLQFTLNVTIQEGRSRNVVITDTLPAGMEFLRTVSINGDIAVPYGQVAPFTHTDIPLSNTPDNAPAVLPLAWTIGDVTNVADNNPANDNFVIVYEARVVDDVAIPQPLPGDTTDALSNTVALNYSLYDNSAAPAETSIEAIDVQQPLIELANISKTRTDLTGTPITDPFAALVQANDPVQFVLNVCNTGTAPAYDLVISDTLPPELDSPGNPLPDPDVVSVSVNGVDRTSVYDENGGGFGFSAGVIQWTFDTDALSHQAPNNCIDIVYRLNVDPEVGAGAIFSNSMQVDVYYSRDDGDPFEITTRREYGPVGPVSVTVIAQTPMAMIKDGPATATHGEIINYTLTLPDVPAITTLYEVEIQDDLPPGVTYISSSFGAGNGAVGLTDNTAAPDTNNVRLTLDSIPAGAQAVVNVTVRVNSSAGNAGAVITNTSSYAFSGSDGGPVNISGGSDPHSFTVTLPQPQVTKSELGPAASPGADGFIDLGIPEQFSLVIENTLPNTSTIWQATLLDVLPVEMRSATAPLIDSITIGARTLSEDAPDDYDVLYDAETGYFQIVLKSAEARIEAGETLTVVYTAGLLDDTGDALTIINQGLVSQWYSVDTSAGIPPETAIFNQVPGDGTPAVPADDYAHDLTLTSRAPELSVIKNVINLTSGLNPGIAASPGDLLQYTIDVSNSGSLESVFSLEDILDNLNVPPAFVAGSLLITSAIDPAWINNTDPNNGSGVISISNVTIAPAGNIQFVFQVQLQNPLPNGKIVANQATVSAPFLTDILSDNPNTPDLDDPTLTIIGSTPAFIFEKISDDISGDANFLQTGDTLRYTITVKNVGDADSINSVLVDQIPANTTYIANSTTLNGVAVTDIAEGISPLRDGLSINSPGAGPGILVANADDAADNVAVVTFDVVINENLVNGTVISNQGALTGEITQAANDPNASQRFPFLPVFSDDPATPVVGDPTQDVVGQGVNIDAIKTVDFADDNPITPEIEGDVNGNGEVDAGETLQYSVTVTNAGNIDAGTVTLFDNVPSGTTYVPNSTQMGTVPFDDIDGEPDVITPVPDNAGQSPISSSGGLTFDLPASTSVVVTFNVTVNAVAPGTVISNQGVVSSALQPDELTDADGNDENGDQPTVVIVGGANRLAISKEVFVVDGGVARAGGELEYVIRVENISRQTVADPMVQDNIPAGTTLVAGSATLNGFTNGVTESATQIIANYASAYGGLTAGTSFVVRFRVSIGDLALGTSILNTAVVEWNSGANSASASANIDVGGAPGVMNLNGRIWLDPDHDNLYAEGAERAFENWTVRVYFNNNNPSSAQTPIETFTTGAAGEYSINGLAPGGPYTITFAVSEADPLYPPGSNIGLGDSSPSVGSADLMRILAIDAGAGRNVQDENLPVNPAGVIYNSVTRAVVPPGARVSLRRFTGADTAPLDMPMVPELCFEAPAHLDLQQDIVSGNTGGQITGADGFYRFDLNFANAQCPRGADYRIVVELPDSDNPGQFIYAGSVVIPAETIAFDPVNCTVDAVAGTTECEVQESVAPPPANIPPGPGTIYFDRVLFNDPERGMFNNHIPVDDIPDGLVNLSKTTPLKNVVRGQLVPYRIRLENPQEFALSALYIVDIIPPGFKYIVDSSRVNGEAIEPVVEGRNLTWRGLSLQPQDSAEINLLLVIGSGVGEGEYTNTAQAFIAGVEESVSGVASATVRVVPDPTFDCSDIIGKVYDDKNANGYPDAGEPGIAGSRVVTAQGLLTTTDEYGRFHITCAAVPNMDRGSNFILKLDENTLPAGYRVTTENPRVQRLTRGKAIKFNFGATIHRVVRLDLADAAFEPGATEIREHWRYVIDDLFDQLQQKPSVLRIAYLGDAEPEKLAEQRIKKVRKLIESRWHEMSCCYNLMIETEMFWRRGQAVQ